MSGKFQPIKPDTAYLLAHFVQDWLPENHLARVVMAIFDQLDSSELVKRYGGDGKEPYHPALLLVMSIQTMTRSRPFASVFCRNWKACLCSCW